MTCTFSLLHSISVGSIIQRGVLSYKSQIESRHKGVVPNYGEWRVWVWVCVCVCGGGYKPGAGEVLPLQKRGGGVGSFSHAEGRGGGDTNIFEVVLTQELEVLAILIPSKFYPVLSGARCSHFVASRPPPPYY